MNSFLPRGPLASGYYRSIAATLCLLLSSSLSAQSSPQTAAPLAEITLADSAARLVWKKSPAGWHLHEVSALSSPSSPALPLGTPSGRYTLLYSAAAPATAPVKIDYTLSHFDPEAEPRDRHAGNRWRESIAPVALNLAGEALTFLPQTAVRSADGTVEFRHTDDTAEVVARWSLDPAFPGDTRVALTVTAKKSGWFSLATPTLATVARDQLAWATVPGYFQGNTFESDLVLSYAYGHGLPDRPVVLRERTASTLASLVSAKSGATLAVIAEPGTGADPWPVDRQVRNPWKLGLSHLNRQGEISPTLYHPVLGQEGSQLAAGESRTFNFRYTLRAADWFAVLRHAIDDVYRFREQLALREPRQSLSERVRAQHRYVTDDATSLWRTEEFNGRVIGAQAYYGAVIGSDRDAMKNSDYGAMWMLAKITGDPKLTRDRLPFARAFKLAQQQDEPGFFQGSAVGQYYLSKSKRFTEEWGDYVEPQALTFYSMLDLGNILLFSPQDEELRARLRLGAERLLQWQRPDGSWLVGYVRKNEKPTYTDLGDYRATFYGLLVAYRILGDEKYLAAARRGADWLVTHSVATGRYLGVCGDARFVPDFATAQVAQALLDLHAITGEVRYRDAGIAAARVYVASIYTHPIAGTQEKTVNGVKRADWEISQSGLSFEHGGLTGSATNHGPILLASHAGLFVRVHQLTGESLFLDLARAGAVGRDAFVDQSTKVASYYWDKMNAGSGPYPHHAWWQIGWITDYLLSEAALRSRDAITFPRGFFTPKVGPHASYGFAPGKIFGEPATLAWGDAPTGSPAVDCLVARAVGRDRVYLILLNERGTASTATLTPAAAALTGGRATAWTAAHWLSTTGATPAAASTGHGPVTLPPYGFAVLALDFQAPPVGAR